MFDRTRPWLHPKGAMAGLAREACSGFPYYRSMLFGQTLSSKIQVCNHYSFRYSRVDASTMPLATSAYTVIGLFILPSRLLKNIINKSGPKIKPRGAPDNTVLIPN